MNKNRTTKEIKDFDIYTEVITNGKTRVHVAKLYNTSPRSVGRAIERHRNRRANKWLDTGGKVTWESPTKKAVTKKVIKQDEVTKSDETHIIYSAVVMPSTINIWRGDELVSYNRHIHNNSTKFDDAVQIILDGKMSQDSLAKAFKLLSPRIQILSCNIEGVDVCIKTGSVSYHGEQIVGNLASRIVAAANMGDATIFDRLTKFTAKLYKNPSYRAINQLYAFIEATDIEISDSGDVICYKRVRNNFHDIYSGKLDYSVGNTVKIARNLVDENPKHTCAPGLHVCSMSYLPYYSSTHDDQIIQCLVSPEHFVAIPEDYYKLNAGGVAYRAKARVCKITSVKVLDKTKLFG